MIVYTVGLQLHHVREREDREVLKRTLDNLSFLMINCFNQMTDLPMPICDFSPSPNDPLLSLVISLPHVIFIRLGAL